MAPCQVASTPHRGLVVGVPDAWWLGEAASSQLRRKVISVMRPVSMKMVLAVTVSRMFRHVGHGYLLVALTMP